MSFARDYLAELDSFVARSPPSPVRALHLPPLAPAGSPPGKGEFCAVELSDGSLGLSYVLLDDTLARLHLAWRDLGLAGTDALALARRYASADISERTIGFAAANALTRCLYDRAGFSPPASRDSIGELAPAPNEHIGMIGLFRPLLGRVLASGARLTVVELKAELAGTADGYRVTLDAAELENCDKVISTSTLLLNDTLDRMLGHCRAARWFAMVGPGGGCLPDALFARGVTLLGGNWVVDVPAFVDALRRGEPTSPYSLKTALTTASYPGCDTLLARAS